MTIATASSIDAQEREVRVNLAAFYRLVAHYGMTDLAYNHITARVPGTDDQFLINPYGLFYEEMTASSFHKIDIEGNLVTSGDDRYGVNKAGFVIHSAIHSKRHDLTCVAHTHTRAGMVVSATKGGILPLTQMSLRFHKNLGFHAFEGPAHDLEERKRLQDDLGDYDCMIMRNHGLLACGRTIPQAFINLYALEMCCKVQADLMAVGEQNIHRPRQDAIDKTHARFEQQRATAGAGMSGEREWNGLLRMLDRRDPSYRT
jgi:ribulose-5-phosphate 4-epimerase/fuculose-1-phosphate aldolase